MNSVGLALLGSGLAFAGTWFWWNKQQSVKRADALVAEASRKEDETRKRAEVIVALHEEAMKRIVELELRVRLQDVATSPIITAFQALLVKQLTHAAKPEMDALLAKIGPPDTLTKPERKELWSMLTERSTDFSVDIPPMERDAAIILPFVMLMAAGEQAKFTEVNRAEDLKLVTIVSVVGPGQAPGEPETK